ncbi:NAD(P)/FAD-dependent oxidoreductase [Ornithinicoccus hortensis]|uniref:Putative NAD/FAD-binding protein n=1 Tax=Ornithinicoccus hortensis TaxID=82346 RepID=A0A542YQP0_9MICO|nr:FAD-dependent oxidoreductase [Ornithinicoccus hortensis]TQL50422.1 putative NAD/FAD-binding protein [Ornithinicoccus hortensis]
MVDGRPTAAVIGSGVSGLTAAHVLSGSHRVTLLEGDDRFGGHAHTHAVTDSAGRSQRIDSGFIVHNERTYPHLLRLFGELGVRTRETEMSMSVTCGGCGLSYAGGRGPRGILAQPRRAADPRFVRLLTEVPRFHRLARRLLGAGEDDVAADDAGDAARGQGSLTWGQFLRAGGFSRYFVQHFAVPLVACVWSANGQDARDYPARHLFAFLDHHGMLSVTGSPTWRTVVGGSASYVDALVARVPVARSGAPVLAVERHDDGVDVRTGDGTTATFDRVVVATHADDALALLADASAEEKSALSAIGYSTNRTVLHRHPAVLPDRRQARASWNYRLEDCAGGDRPVLVSYWMNRLHGLDSPDDFVVTLNPGDTVPGRAVVAEMTYRHPVFTHVAVAAAGVLRGAGGPRLAFAGAHLGWGFHEDGCRSGVQAAERLGATW